MEGSIASLAVLLALLAGLAIGKAWERYKLHDGRWIDRRRGASRRTSSSGSTSSSPTRSIARSTSSPRPQSSPAIRWRSGSILGNLYREKGQVGRAIQEHQALLQRPNLRKLEHANALLCLGLDYKSGGFVDRALSAFSDVLRLDPDNEYALSNLEKLYEEQHQWERRLPDAPEARGAAGPAEHRPAIQAILAFLENELGPQALKRMDYAEAARRFEAAIELDATNTPAQPEPRRRAPQRGDVAAAVATWERLIERSPDRAYLAFARLEGAYPHLGDTPAISRICAAA